MVRRFSRRRYAQVLFEVSLDLRPAAVVNVGEVVEGFDVVKRGRVDPADPSVDVPMTLPQNLIVEERFVVKDSVT